MTSSKSEIKPEECSEIGLLLLEEINKHELTFTEMADKMDISRAALRIACLKLGNPGKRMIPKLAKILDYTESKVNQLIQENQIKQMYENE